MKIVSANGDSVTVSMREIKDGETFRYPTGSALYMVTSYAHQTSGRLVVNLATGNINGEESRKQVVPIKNVRVVVDDPFFTVGE